jgi:hypothetical protein
MSQHHDRLWSACRAAAMTTAAVLACPSLSLAAIERVECPSELPEKSMRLIDTPPGWRSYVAAPLYLHAAAPIDGPPEALGQLRGTATREGKTTWTHTYDLTGPFPEGKWLQCSYGMLNEVSLSKRLDDDIKACTITGRKGDKAGQNVFEIVCK